MVSAHTHSNIKYKICSDTIIIYRLLLHAGLECQLPQTKQDIPSPTGRGDINTGGELYFIPGPSLRSPQPSRLWHPASLYHLHGPGQPLDPGYARSNTLTFSLWRPWVKREYVGQQ